MGALERAKAARKRKCFALQVAIELLISGCGDTCDGCPIVRICEKYFREDPREWNGCGLERRES